MNQSPADWDAADRETDAIEQAWAEAQWQACHDAASLVDRAGGDVLAALYRFTMGLPVRTTMTPTDGMVADATVLALEARCTGAELAAWAHVQANTDDYTRLTETIRVKHARTRITHDDLMRMAA